MIGGMTKGLGQLAQLPNSVNIEDKFESLIDHVPNADCRDGL